MSMGAWLLISLITGSIGMGYFIYGKKQGKLVPLCAGVLLAIYPYFVSNLYASIGVGLALILAPMFIKFEF